MAGQRLASAARLLAPSTYSSASLARLAVSPAERHILDLAARLLHPFPDGGHELAVSSRRCSSSLLECRRKMLDSTFDHAHVASCFVAGLLAIACASGAQCVLCEADVDVLEAEKLAVRSAIAGSHWPEVQEWCQRRGVDAPVTASHRSALSLAAEKGSVFIVKGLLEMAADPQSCDNQGLPVLLYAAKKGHAPVVQELLSSGAAVDKPVDIFGNAPIHGAVGFAHPQVVRELLLARCDPDQRQGDVRAPEEYGALTLHETPLHLACRVKPPHLEIQSRNLVILLLQFGANPCLQDDRGDTPAHHLVRKGDAETLWALLSRVPHEFSQLVAYSIPNARGLTVVEEAAEGGLFPVRLVVRCAPVAAYLRELFGLSSSDDGKDHSSEECGSSRETAAWKTYRERLDGGGNLLPFEQGGDGALRRPGGKN